MKTSKILMIVVFVTVFAIFVYQVVSLGAIILHNHSAMKEKNIQSLAQGEEGIVIRSGLPNSNQLVFSCNVEIQSHGYSHKLCTQNSVETTKEEILKTEKVILDILGVKTNVFAPPSGDYDETTVELCKSLDYKLALWNADTIDWREGSTADVIKDRILKKNLNGAIVLMHPKEETVKALPDLIAEIRAQKIDIVPLYRLSH